MAAIDFQYKLVNLEECLMGFAYRLTTNKDNAKDLVQETFLKALVYSDKFAYESNLKAWMYTIMKNTFINNYRSSLRHSTFNDKTKEGFYITGMHISNAETPDSAYASKELEEIINALDDEFKLPFKMRNEGFKYKEIAEKLDLNIGTVKSRIFLTRKKLMEQLNEI